MDQITSLLHEIEAFIAERGMAETTFGRLAANDGKLVGRIRNRTITFKTAERIREFIGTQRSLLGDAAASKHPKGLLALNRKSERALIEQLRRLPPERVAEVKDFADFLCSRTQDAALVDVFVKGSEQAFKGAWDNPDDADYDRL